MAITFLTDDGKYFNSLQEAKDHEECIPLIRQVEELLNKHFGDAETIRFHRLAEELVETDLAFTLSHLLKKVTGTPGNRGFMVK